MSKFTHGETGSIGRLPHCWQRTVDALGACFESLCVCMDMLLFKLLVRVVISEKQKQKKNKIQKNTLLAQCCYLLF